MVYYAAQMEGQHVSLSALDRRCADLFFYWDVFNVFLGALFGGTVLAELKTFLQDPSYIWCAALERRMQCSQRCRGVCGTFLTRPAPPLALLPGLRWAAPSPPHPTSSCERLAGWGLPGTEQRAAAALAPPTAQLKDHGPFLCRP